MPHSADSDDERQRARRQPVEHVRRVGVQHEDPDERDDARDDRRDDRAAPEVLDHRVVASRRASQMR